MPRSSGQWKEFDFVDVLGMNTNTLNPPRNTARRILNVHSHQEPGKLKVRPGYTLKYPAPTESTIIEFEFMNFDMFFDRQASDVEEEITCEIQKGKVVALADSGLPDTDTLIGYWFWCRPHWDLNHWEDGWEWVNKTIITKITTGRDDIFKSMIKIYGGDAHGLGDDSLRKYTIWNKTKNQFAKIITCKAEDATTLRLNITLFDNEWETNDVVVISKYWIDLDHQTTLHNTVNKEDIVFHNILNDIRIGFGGKPLRLGIAIGQRQTSYQIGKEETGGGSS
jgi:hypothetical protein